MVGEIMGESRAGRRYRFSPLSPPHPPTPTFFFFFPMLTLSFTSRVAAETKRMCSYGILKPANAHRHHESFRVKEEMWATVKLDLPWFSLCVCVSICVHVCVCDGVCQPSCGFDKFSWHCVFSWWLLSVPVWEPCVSHWLVNCRWLERSPSMKSLFSPV